MPGANCSIFGCGTSRKHTGVGIFRIPTGEDDLSKKTPDAWLCVVTKDREVDQNLRRQMENRTLYVCEKHFETQSIECCKYILYISISNAALTCKTIKLLVKCVDLSMDK